MHEWNLANNSRQSESTKRASSMESSRAAVGFMFGGSPRELRSSDGGGSEREMRSIDVTLPSASQ